MLTTEEWAIIIDATPEMLHYGRHLAMWRTACAIVGKHRAEEMLHDSVQDALIATAIRRRSWDNVHPPRFIAYAKVVVRGTMIAAMRLACGNSNATYGTAALSRYHAAIAIGGDPTHLDRQNDDDYALIMRRFNELIEMLPDELQHLMICLFVHDETITNIVGADTKICARRAARRARQRAFGLLRPFLQRLDEA